ncbi:hypothetical protein KIPB_006396, partial [Kipferlia bialata]
SPARATLFCRTLVDAVFTSVNQLLSQPDWTGLRRCMDSQAATQAAEPTLLVPLLRVSKPRPDFPARGVGLAMVPGSDPLQFFHTCRQAITVIKGAMGGNQAYLCAYLPGSITSDTLPAAMSDLISQADTSLDTEEGSPSLLLSALAACEGAVASQLGPSVQLYIEGDALGVGSSGEPEQPGLYYIGQGETPSYVYVSETAHDGKTVMPAEGVAETIGSAITTFGSKLQQREWQRQ